MKVQKKVKRLYKLKQPISQDAAAHSLPIKKVEILEGEENFEVDEITPVEQVVGLPSDDNIAKDCSDDSVEKKHTLNVEASEEGEKSKTKWGKYEKRYKIEWENDPNLKEWMLPHPVEAGRVFCRFCHCSLRAHKADLYKHQGAKKHSRNASTFSDDEKKQLITIKKTSFKPHFTTKKLKGPEGSIVIVKCEQPLFYPEEGDNSEFIIDYGDNDHVETTIQSESPRKDPDQEIRELATRVGSVLMDDLEALLKSQGSILKICRSAGDDVYSDGNLRKVAKICVAHLSQRYLVDSVLESQSTNHIVTKEQKELSTKFKDIEEKLEKTVAEMKSLKLSLNGSAN